MFSKLKRILHPENMLFKMIILNCGLLLLVTLVLTAAGNYIYEESIAERSYANTMEIQNQVLKSLDLIFKSVEDNVEALGNYPAGKPCGIGKTGARPSSGLFQNIQ